MTLCDARELSSARRNAHWLSLRPAGSLSGFVLRGILWLTSGGLGLIMVRSGVKGRGNPRGNSRGHDGTHKDQTHKDQMHKNES